MTTTFAERLEHARKEQECGEVDGAFCELRWAFYEPDLAHDAERLTQALQVLSPLVLEALGNETARLVEACVGDLDDPQGLYDLGYQMVEVGLPEVAICTLSRANHLAPGQEAILTELVAALEREGHNDTACTVLRAADGLCQESFICRYLLAFNSIMTADLDTPRTLLPTLQTAGEPDEAYMAARIQAMLDRAGALDSLDRRDLRGWHHVTTGGLLLHISPYGFDEGMNGRYAYVADTLALCHFGLRRLQRVLEAWGESPPWILAPPDRDSQILAAAAEELLGLPVVEYSADAGPGLVVAYDLSRLDEATPVEILDHAPGQILYAHATCWTDPPRCAPDITTFLYQAIQVPWGERMQVAPDGEVSATAQDVRSVEELASAMLAEAPDYEALEQLDPEDQLVQVATVMGPRMAFRGPPGPRSPLWEGGPVTSNRFV